MGKGGNVGNVGNGGKVDHAEKRPANLTPKDEFALFQAAVKDVRPLAQKERIVPTPERLPPVPVQGLIDDQDALVESLTGRLTPELALETGEEANYVRDGFPNDLTRRLRRGQWVVQSELDLHGATREMARELLADFLRECAYHGWRCVRIIHGKGLGSKNREPVLKIKVRLWLAQRDQVLAYCQAPPVQGGGGALLVLLKGRAVGAIRR